LTRKSPKFRRSICKVRWTFQVYRVFLLAFSKKFSYIYHQRNDWLGKIYGTAAEDDELETKEQKLNNKNKELTTKRSAKNNQETVKNAQKSQRWLIDCG